MTSHKIGYARVSTVDQDLAQQIDTRTTSGRLDFTILAALGEAERERIQERTLAGLVVARERGRVGGQPPELTPKKLDLARRRLGKAETGATVAEPVGVSRSTLTDTGGRRAVEAVRGQ